GAPSPTPGATPSPTPTATASATPTATATATPGNISGLTADYQFQNTRNSSVGSPPALQDEGSGNSFTTDTVGCVSRTVLSFPAGSGLVLAPITGVIPNKTYTIVVLFKFTDQNKNRAIIDFKNGQDGRGIYADSENNLAFPNS